MYLEKCKYKGAIMGKKIKSKKKVQKNRRKSTKKILFLIIIILIVVIVISKMKTENNEENSELKLILSNNNVTQELENGIIKKDEIIYLSIDDIQKLIDNTIYVEDNLIITTSERKIAKLELDKKKLEVNGTKISINGNPYKESGEIYLPISEMEDVYDIDFNEIGNNIIIDYYSDELIKAYTNKKVKVKSEKSGFSQTIEKIKKGNWLVYISEEDGWSKVRTQNGNLGYVKTKYLTNYVTERQKMQTEATLNDAKRTLEKTIKEQDISTYSKRKKIINDIFIEAVNKNYNLVNIKFGQDENEYIERFKIEIKPILKECGINVEFSN